MKAEDIKIAIEAVNKFIYYGWNFTTEPFSFKGYNGETVILYVPRFIKEVKWDCPTFHMASKWSHITETYPTDAWVTRFYAQLGNSNRRQLIEWVMLHYDGERKIN